MADQFDAVGKARGEDEVARDRWGRYKLPHPEDGNLLPWTRATTFAKSISDTFALSQWSQRMAVKGLTVRPDLLAMAHSLDVKADRDKFNKLVDDAKAAAGDKVAANMGTALHSFSENVDAGMDLEMVPEPHRADIAAYKAAMDNAGVRVVPQMIERQTVLPAFEVAGTFDRILNLDNVRPWFRDKLTEMGFPVAAGEEVIGDVKSGQDLQYGWNEIAIQLLIYALGVRNHGVWVNETKTWLPPRPVRVDFAIVMHMPVGQKTCTLYALDLRDAMAALDLCRGVRRWRKLRVLATPLERAVTTQECPCGGEDPGGHVDGCPNDTGTVVEGLSLLERFKLAGSRGELSALFAEAVESGAWVEGGELEQAGRDRLKILEEKAG